MDEKKLLAICDEARAIGGVNLRHQKLRVHANGAKFTINKNYLDDEILSDRNLYTMILIPEFADETGDDEFFHGIKFEEIKFVYNELTMNLILPFFVLDSNLISAKFTASISKIQSFRLLPKNLTPVEVSPGRCAIFINCFEIKKFELDPRHMQESKPSFDPFNKCSIAILVSHEAVKGIYPFDVINGDQGMLLGDYIVNPFNINVADSNRFQGVVGDYVMNPFHIQIADSIRFRDTEGGRTCEVFSGQKLVLKLNVKKLPTNIRITMSAIYSQHKGKLQRLQITQKGNMGKSTAGDDAQLILGDHDVARRLKDLEINLQSISCNYCTNVKCIIGPLNIIERIE
ncbi:MAG: hypothetical protein RBG13Loki_2303 [Promethearchaeota archaeon CR_4]|nr:MAG: hypothetical protein RBG13Loki_2303 [Candidatus Lokiarchaeota archaeon CR_4]